MFRLNPLQSRPYSGTLTLTETESNFEQWPWFFDSISRSYFRVALEARSENLLICALALQMPQVYEAILDERKCKSFLIGLNSSRNRVGYYSAKDMRTTSKCLMCNCFCITCFNNRFIHYIQPTGSRAKIQTGKSESLWWLVFFHCANWAPSDKLIVF